jgi:uncharacterized protein YbjT (DUF2867 family)
MRVVIAGGHGKIAQRLERLLAERGDEAVGIVRNPEHVADVEAAGAQAVVLDLEQASVDDVAEVVRGADAVVFAAGAGPGSGAARKRTVDLGAAVKLIDAAEQAGVRRYVMISSIGAQDPSSGGEQMQPYLEAKAAADEALTDSDLDWTVVRPGGLTDDHGTGKVRIESMLGRRGRVPRQDVAATLVAVLDEPATIGKVFELFTGDTKIAEAVRRI